MDGGARQQDMAERLKREVKDKSHHRRGERTVRVSGERVSTAEAATGDWIVLPQELHRQLATPVRDVSSTEPSPVTCSISMPSGIERAHPSDDAHGSKAAGQTDTILIMFYLEHLLPFLFPFYRPGLLQGGRSWILEMMIKSPVVRQALICQSSFFFSLAHGVVDADILWETVLTQTRDAFGVLRQALQVIDGSDIVEHLHGAVRIMTSIMAS
jgi:C6 transcription factor Pro1